MIQLKCIVYIISCKDYDKYYIGQSASSHIYTLKEHKRAVQKGDKVASAIGEHVWECHHDMDW